MPNNPGIETLERYQQREFVPEGVSLRDARTAQALFIQLIERPVASSDELERWIADASELSAALDQEGTVLYIRMTCDTSHPQFAADYRAFVQEVLPAVKPLMDQLNRKFLEFTSHIPIDANRYRVFERNLRADVELFRQDNVALETDVQLLAQEYQSVSAVMTVDFNGREQTMPEMAAYQLQTDRDVRERAWRATAQRRRQDADRIEGIFDVMLGLRDTIARNAGFANFTDYQFRQYHRFDYGPEHCRRYHEAVVQCVVPVWRRILEKRRRQMGLETLRPWDLSVDPQGAPPLKPFAEVGDLITGAEKIFSMIDPDLGSAFEGMASKGLLDLESRRGKAPGGYQNTLAEARQPFIFMNAVGIDADVRTLLHEGGHAFHALACADEPLYAYRHAPIEFCEIASMSMELLGNQFLNVFYNEADSRRSVINHLEGIVHILAWVANIDAFQHWIYEHPGHTLQERYAKWVELYQTFNGTETDWRGLEGDCDILWHRQLHIFEVPFYYIEYGIAQLGALQIWKNSRRDPKAALEKYKNALALGGSRTLPELFATAGIEFDFSEKTIAPLVCELEQELEGMG